jgi:hypothetical protein
VKLLLGRRYCRSKWWWVEVLLVILLRLLLRWLRAGTLFPGCTLEEATVFVLVGEFWSTWALRQYTFRRCSSPAC